MLEVLGVEPRVERVYRALLGRPGTTTAALAAALQVPEAEVDEGLVTLVGTGLALRSADLTFVAAPPTVALGALITERRDGLRLAEQALASLAEEHRAAVAGLSVDALIEVVTGVDPIRHRYLQVQQAATTQLRMFVTAPFVAVPPSENTAETAAAERGVRIRVVIERAVLEGLESLGEVVDSLQHGLELRVVDQLPLKLVLADADLALVPLAVAPAGEPGAVLLQRSGLLAALDALFESVWRGGHPLTLSGLGDAIVEHTESSEGPTTLDRQVMSLMLAGLSDQAVAAQLGLSLRTVQRRVRYLQDLAGVQTRMQLGWHAARHGWD
jgi:DNA-binding CsgD family transcriptional regulator